MTSAYTKAQWTTDPPAIISISPSELPVHPEPGLDPSTSISITGTNFGPWAGDVVIGGRRLVCSTWSNEALACNGVAGVVVSASVVVTASSTRTSTGVRSVQFRAPVIQWDGRAAGGLSTVGGEQLPVPVANLAHQLPLFSSVWLVRGAARPSPPWVEVLPPATNALLRCGASTNGSAQTGASVGRVATCITPPGSGRGWRLVVVNHDIGGERVPPTPGTASVDLWRASDPSSVEFMYRPPVVLTVGAVGGSLPARGGFVLQVFGRDFSSFTPEVFVGSQPCRVVGPHPRRHDMLECMVPPRQVDTSNQVVVAVDGQTSNAVPLMYDGPVVVGVEPSVIDAGSGTSTGGHGPRVEQIVLKGFNFGVRYMPGLTPNHSVLVGGQACTAVMWDSDTTLTCIPPHTLVPGSYNLTITVAGGPQSQAFVIAASCPSGFFGRGGEACTVCPSGAMCLGRGSDPVALPGFFPTSRTVFVPCTPPGACAGGHTAASGLVGCTRLYAGALCGQCSHAAYRVGTECIACPNTEWVLFLVLGLAFSGSLLAVWYIRKKRISMAGLSVGVVRSPLRAMSPVKSTSVKARTGGGS